MEVSKESIVISLNAPEGLCDELVSFNDTEKHLEKFILANGPDVFQGLDLRKACLHIIGKPLGEMK